MAYIYTITNTINDKQYVGKTIQEPPLKRFQEHLREYRQDRSKERPLYRAFNKYGTDKFVFQVIEVVSPEETSNREIFWIDKLKTYGSNGYNGTKGGDGLVLLNYDKIVKDYKSLRSATQVALENNCHEDSVRNILSARGVPILSSSSVIKEKYGTKVVMLDMKTEKVLMEFESMSEASQWLIDNNHSKVAPKNMSGLRNKIKQVCEGKRSTSSGFKWRYID